MVATLLGRGPTVAAVNVPMPLTPTCDAPRPLPTVQQTEEPTGSPPTNTPSKLKRFLEYAEKNLGVANATDYTYLLSSKGYGPNILHRVKDESLVTLGIPPGDVIWLQDNALKWWNGPNAKRRFSHADNESNDKHTKKHVCFEKRYRDESGKYSLWGYKLVAGDVDPGADYEWWYYSEAHDAVVPVPQGYVPLLEEEGDNADAPF